MNKTTVAQQAKTTVFLPPHRGILQRKCACGKHKVTGGECVECVKNKSGLQRKLSIGASNDLREQEADRVADQVMTAPGHSPVSTTPLRIQRYAGQATEGVETAPASVDRVLVGSGRPLEPALRQDMEQRFGQDFSRVRVHSGTTAEQSAKDVNANAYTVAQNVVFGAGRFAPGSHEGRWLLAHELAHTIQQRGVDAGVQRFSPDWLTAEDDSLEHEANHAAQKVVTAGFAHVVGSARTVAPQRQNKDKKNQSQAPKVVSPVEPSKAQKKMIDEARSAAAVRTQTAMFKASGIQGAGQFQEANRLAQIKFDWASPNMDQISEVLRGMGGGLVTVDVKVAGVGDPDCGSRAGYVRDHRQPIVLCPGFFADPGNNEGRIRTMIHEMAHVKGIGKADAGEQYFPVFDCTSKGAFESADSWANYVHCLSGRTPDKPEEIVVPAGGSKAGKQAPKKSGGSK